MNRLFFIAFAALLQISLAFVSDDPAVLKVENPIETEKSELSAEAQPPVGWTIEDPMFPPSTPPTDTPKPGDFFDVVKMNGINVLSPKFDISDDILRVFAKDVAAFLRKMNKAPCDSAENLRSNMIYVALETIIATEGRPWMNEEKIQNLEKSLETAPEELKPDTEQLIKAVNAYYEMSKVANRNATTILDRINEAVISDGETVNLIASHYGELQNDEILSQCCEIVDRVGDSLSKFTEPIVNILAKFVEKMTLNQLKGIILTITDITDLFKAKEDGEQAKLNIPETKKKIVDFTSFLMREIDEAPKRFEDARSIVVNFVEEAFKASNPNNPEGKLCEEENYIKSELFTPIQKLVEVQSNSNSKLNS